MRIEFILIYPIQDLPVIFVLTVTPMLGKYRFGSFCCRQSRNEHDGGEIGCQSGHGVVIRDDWADRSEVASPVDVILVSKSEHKFSLALL